MKMCPHLQHKRGEQLRRWVGSQTDSESPVMKKKKLAKVKFDDGAVFLAACSSGDTGEVLRLLERGADINHSNVDGLSALHQACIDENIDMVRFLVECGANINQADNEGWTPLHAAASCGYFDIAKYLLHHGVNVAAVNNEGELPLDITEDEAMEEMLQEELNRQGVDVEAARKEEQQLMLRDAHQWLNSRRVHDVRHPKSGGSALHVAAAKSYVDVLKLLIQTGMDINVRDNDGWTPLHAAAHWGKEEACHILVENLCDMHAVNKVGQTAFDVADEDILGYLEELVAKQKAVSLGTYASSENIFVIETLSSLKEKQRGEDRTQERKIIERANEGDVSLHKDDSSSSSSDSECEPEGSETEEETAENAGIVDFRDCFGGSFQSRFPTLPEARREDIHSDERRDESPATWRQGLRKTGSYGALPEAGSTGTTQGVLREKDPSSLTTTGLIRSASSPRLTTLEKDIEKRLARVLPTISDGNRTEDKNIVHVHSFHVVIKGKYIHALYCANIDLNKLCFSPLCVCSIRSYLTPVRDEESESQRKARSRQARQTRRSTQGITLTDLREAEKIRMHSSDQRAKEQPQPSQEEGKQESNRAGLETKDILDIRVRYVRNPITEVCVASTFVVFLIMFYSRMFQRKSSALSGESAEEDVSADGERQEGKARLSVRERRRPREKRRSTGVSYRPLDVIFVFASLLFFFFSFLLCFYFHDCPPPSLSHQLLFQVLSTFLCVVFASIQTLGELKADNQRLKDENAALIRVISKLSK
uniref:Protein phosphatase 1 regulatory subunit n=1 Tax=Eptatretus burgeri TaxID=7764 RepID=A0A8C4NFG0_EPTBU